MSLISHVIILLQCIYLCGLSAEKCMDMSNIRKTCLIQYTNKSNLYEKVGMINQYLDNIMSPYFYKYFMQLKNKRPMGHIAHLRKQFKSLYHNVDLEKKKKHY